MAEGVSDKDEDLPSALSPSLVGVRLVDAPVLFLVVSHKAFRAELSLLRRTASEAAHNEDFSREVVVDIGRRLEFLKLVYNYHCAAEDEVIFLSLDARVQNVVQTYSLEHKSIDDSFSSIFHHLDLLTSRDEDAPQIFQNLLFSIGTIQSMICQHMQKEEEQVFPLLMQKLSPEEQSQLVWQYMCSVPIILLEDFLPWMASYLSSDEKLDLLPCIKRIIPKEDILLGVVVSWIQHKEIHSSDASNVYKIGHQFLNGLSSSTDILKLFPNHIQYDQEEQFKEAVLVDTNVVEGPIKGIYLWHAALRLEFGQIIEELYQIRSSTCFSSLSSVIVQLKFVADVLIFYSNCLDKIFYPLLYQLAKNSLSPCSKLVDENQIICLQRLLVYEREGSVQLRNFLEMLCKELESLLAELNKNLVFLELEVFPLISSNCTKKMQLWLLYTSLHVMPLGLLKCTVTWFSANLSENQSNSVLTNLKVECSVINKSFTSLLQEWVRVGCSGKTSTAKFRQILEEMFNGRSFYLSDHIRAVPSEPDSAIETRTDESGTSSSLSLKNEGSGVSHPTGMNLNRFFSQMFKRIPHIQTTVQESETATFFSLESRPMDYVLYIHRALVKDLEHLVSLSPKLTSNVGVLAEFKKRFKLLQNIYHIHSRLEDEIAFPALESKVALQNISHSYSIDHKLEAKQFRRTSRILDEISDLQYEDTDKSRQKYYQLCLMLHDACLSMQKVLMDHIHREEVEIFPLFSKFFTVQEEENIVGHMLGRTRAEVLQEIIPWLMAYLTSDEQHVIISLWLKVTKYTNFSQWLGEWWEGMTRYKVVEEGSRTSPLLAVVDPMEVVTKYLLKDGTKTQEEAEEKKNEEEFGHFDKESQDISQYAYEVDKKKSDEANDSCINDKAEIHVKESVDVNHKENALWMNQEELEATIRRVSRDSTLDTRKKSIIIQNLLMSRWIVTQKSNKEANEAKEKGEIPGQSPSYHDSSKLIFGCKHYKRNCKFFAPCCNQLYTCIRCHDEQTDHAIDRKSITKMMCMRCLEIQLIGPNCISHACGNFSMARYYCKICKLFDDGRKIYHCPYCNLCRLGKGLDMDYFHCMKCNGCMNRSLFVHTCRENSTDDNCPICHEYLFTSSSPVKALPCGHLMHSACFQVYTCSHYICPICSKSLGDMQVYFGMLDALLAEEKIPDEYSGQVQIILCNDCEKKGNASFHWLHHKCPYCGSYNTRLL